MSFGGRSVHVDGLVREEQCMRVGLPRRERLALHDDAFVLNGALRVIVALRNVVHENDRLSNERDTTIRVEIADKAKALSEVDQQTKNLLESFSVGGIDLEFVGCVWLFVGVCAGTIPDEMAYILKCFLALRICD